ncbi:hypothetical protein K503DRAFT_866507 [Rhizopogon vinicolor AM-OR11-026]|uniref:DUF6533 domain-containing protein n=1 Tax=Rhizopogon vinicolor AM-OR11-026 TaxID=1314800 RepID=A0A1B7MZF5_9AGAM|nr:hypothetical protein K503DRAFT_866507 [Rhizopogon vinicolor AM-OR11-026]
MSDDSDWVSIFDAQRTYNYFIVASSIMVVYDWALTFGREVDLLWVSAEHSPENDRTETVNSGQMQHWSLMTLLYFSVRYIGILYTATMILGFFPIVPLTDIVSTIILQILVWTDVVIDIMLRVILIVRLYAMYQRSRKILIFLIATSMALTIVCGALIVVLSSRLSGDALVIFGTHMCVNSGYDRLLSAEAWIISTAWEVLALCLAAWIAVKHFRELRLRQKGWAFKDSFKVLMRSHIFYFAGFVAVAFFTLGDALSPNWSEPALAGVLKIALAVQMFVLGPRLILSLREFNAELVVNSDAGTGLTTMAFQEGVLVSSGGNE